MLISICLLVIPLVAAWLVTARLARSIERAAERTFIDYAILSGAHLGVGVLMAFLSLIGAEMLGAFSRSPDSGMAAGVGMAFVGGPALLLSCIIQMLSLPSPSRER